MWAIHGTCLINCGSICGCRRNLLGSYARGTATEDSDLDLMAFKKESPDKAAEYLRLCRAIGGIGVGVDVLIYTEEEVLLRSTVPGTLPYSALKEVQVLHDDLA